jgi:hypothetical protein
VPKHHIVKAYRDMEVNLYVLKYVALAGGEWPALRLIRFIPCAHCERGWIDPRAYFDAVAKKNYLFLQGIETRLYTL